MVSPVSWLTLKSVPGVGNLLFRRLVEKIGSPRQVLRSSRKTLIGVAGVTPRIAAAIRNHRTPDWVRREIDLCRRKGYKIITRQDGAYPALLRHIPDPPPVLYCHGSLDGEDGHIAMVGSRRATAYGKTSAARLARELAEKGLSVVSGMARGIDTAAHWGALDGGGRTVAVLGSGLERVYPRENRKLFHRIAECGAVVSEFPLFSEPEPHHFPQRNRIISGMSLGTVVVEATRRSGSLITARLAAEQGREVFAVPGSVQAPTAKGTHDLIKQGAKLVENAEDIIEEVAPHISCPTLNQPAESRQVPVMSAEEADVYRAVGHYPVHIDELARRCDLDIGRLTAVLTQLEIAGAVLQEPGKYFIRSSVEEENTTAGHPG